MENQLPRPTETHSLSVAEAVTAGARRLLESGIESARLDAELLLGCVLEMSREQLLLSARLALSLDDSARFESLLLRRAQREPLAYITQNQEFWSLSFLVTRDVLVPRPETELLVETGLKWATEKCCADRLRILDLGTGSGAIAIALASELRERAEIFATDISAEALAVARYNAATNGVSKNIRFFQGDLFAAIDHRIECEFDLIVSNPPYICSKELPCLEPEVSRWEPRAALDGGLDGLDFYRRIVLEAVRHLRPGGTLILEIGAAMGAKVLALFNSIAAYGEQQIRKDYGGHERVAVVSKATDPMSFD